MLAAAARRADRSRAGARRHRGAPAPSCPEEEPGWVIEEVISSGANCRCADIRCSHGRYAKRSLLADPGGPSPAAPSPAAPAAAAAGGLRRARDGVALDVTEAAVLLAARGEQLDELLAAAARGPRRRAGRRRPARVSSPTPGRSSSR